MMEKKLKVPKATMKRYPIYLKALKKMRSRGIDRVLSSDLAIYCDTQATTIRRDFSFIGSLGKQGFGYSVDYLIEVFDNLLGVNYDEKIVLVGVGNLGKALLNYNRWDQVVGEIVVGFDTDNKKSGEISGVPVYHLSQLKNELPKECRLAIVTVTDKVQETVDLLIDAGIVGIIDFSHEHVQVPNGVFLRQVDVVAAIQEIVFQVNHLD